MPMFQSLFIVHLIAGQLGRDKTIQKIKERFYWKTIWTDVQAYIYECEACHHANDTKFMKATEPLHPIPIKSEVCNQVLLHLTSIIIITFTIMMNYSD